MRRNLILLTSISMGALVMGVGVWGIVHNYNVQKRNQPYDKFYFQNINGKDVYFNVRDAGDTRSVLFANKYVQMYRDAFVSEVDNKLYINESLLFDSLDLNYKPNPNNSVDYTFYPPNAVDGQTKIKVRYVNESLNAIDAPIDLTFYDKTTSGEDLYRIGYYLQRPTQIREVPKTDQIYYRVTENGENIYYMHHGANVNSYRNTTDYLHAKEYASRTISPTSYSKPVYYRFLDDFDFTLNEEMYITHTIGLKDNNVEFIEDLPEGILEKNIHVDRPSTIENETYYIGLMSGGENTMHRYKFIWKATR